MTLEDYGYSAFFSQAFEALEDPHLEPGRVLRAASEVYRLASRSGELTARPSGRLRGGGPSSPAVGDWVAFEREEARIRHLLPRRTKLSRKVAGRRTEEQVVAANVDTVFIVVGLDNDFNPRRVERFLTSVWESGAVPIVILNKADVCLDVEERRGAIEEVAPGVDVLVASSLQGAGLEAIRSRLPRGRSAVLVGSSGVGKSTLVNRLLGEATQATGDVRPHDGRGRHTTTDRAVFRLPWGGLLIDGPGVREVQLWAGEESLERSFEDVSRLAAECRFRDCAHGDEPGCAVVDAVAGGRLDASRLSSFRALQREVRYLERRQDESAQRVEKQKWRAIHREMRKSGRHRRT